ncbi:tetratricopeptide repeat protein [Roseibium sp. MMSF_3544]|uniref:tetratricopeptide repeat protein n=1 Tax=unclassified Roseibium TaxID=2629323 RepID=UPI00273F3E83|nr:tetratricopeptide repeat protein [Roseibium sp. MMSF_3544]
MNLTVSEKCDAAEDLIEKGKLEDAEFLLDQVLESHPAEIRALVGKSALLIKSGDLQKAKALLQSAYERSPSDAVVQTNLANVALLENRINDAVVHLETAHAERSDYLPPILLLAQIRSQSGEATEAASWLTKATKLAPGDANVLAAGAGFLLAHQKISEAKASFEKALDVDPGHVGALAGLAQLSCLLGEFDRAGELAKRAHLLSPQDPEVAVTLAKVYLAAGAPSEAEKLMDRFKARLADFTPVVLVCAEIAIARGQTAQALSDTAKWLRKAPNDQMRIAAFLKVLKQAGAWQEIVDMYLKLPDKTASEDMVQSLYEEALHALGRSEEAWRSWTARRGLEAKAPTPPIVVELPERTPLLDEIVLMRFANSWAQKDPISMVSKSPLEGIWGRLTSAAQIGRTADRRDLQDQSNELLADLAARTCLFAPEVAAFNPYLAPSTRVAEWRNALPSGRGPLVGVFWQERAPGLMIDHLKAAFAGKDVVPVSLQFDDARHQLRTWPEAMDAGVALGGLEDLVDLIDCLDLIVGPDGIPLHIAGALGRKGVALLQKNHEWYWAGTGSESIWYPSVKRVVTAIGPTWEGAADAVAAEIDALLV